MKKWWIGLTIILFFGLIAGGYNYWKEEQTKTVPTTVTASRSDLRVAFSLDGELMAETYSPKLAIAGRVKSVLVKEGDKVKQGQWLLTLDATEAQKNLEKVLRDYSKERNDFDQDKQVTYLDTVVTDTIKRILEKNQWDLDKAVLDVELKDLALAESRLKSPISGVISKIEVRAGDVINTQNQPVLITIVKPNSWTFEAAAEEAEALKIDTKQKVEITLDAYPKESWEGKLDYVATVAERDSNGIASYPVKATFANLPEQKLLDGMEGSLTFITKEVANVVVIPNKAVFREGSQAYVEVISGDGKTVKTKITTGFTNGKEVEVVSGVETGTKVAIPSN